MDPFHERLAHLALDVAADYGFCLAGGYAVQAHGFVDRASEDIDLFTTMAAVDNLPAARAAVVDALRGDGLDVAVELDGPMFSRLQVSDPHGEQHAKIELGVDWRAKRPVNLEVGPVLHPDDAAANKLCALFGRAAPRDYIDVHAVLQDGRYTSSRLLRMAVEHDPGFDRMMFAGALRAVQRLPDSAFKTYKITDEQVDALRARLLAWADEIDAAANG